MEQKELKPLKWDITKLCTQAKYAKMIGLSRSRVNQMVKNKEIKSIDILGATLIVLP